MNALPMSYQGTFQLWAFDVSHGRLLLRRKASAPALKRVDIVFAGVELMRICTCMDSLKIDEVTAKEIGGSDSARESTKQPGLRWFKIVSKDWEGYICAGAVQSHEDDLDFSAPSAIFEPGPLAVSSAVASSWFQERYAAAVPKSGQ